MIKLQSFSVRDSILKYILTYQFYDRISKGSVSAGERCVLGQAYGKGGGAKAEKLQSFRRSKLIKFDC